MSVQDFDRQIDQATRAIIAAKTSAGLALALGIPETSDPATIYATATGVLSERARMLLERLDAAGKRIAQLEAEATYRRPGIPAGYQIEDDFDAIREFDQATRGEYQGAETMGI